MEAASVPDDEDSEETLDLTELQPDDEVDAALQDARGANSAQGTETRVVADSSSGPAPAEEHTRLQENRTSELADRLNHLQEDLHAPKPAGGQAETKEKRMSKLAERLSHLQEDLHAPKPPVGQGEAADAVSRQAMYDRIKKKHSVVSLVSDPKSKELEDRVFKQQEELAAQRADIDHKYAEVERKQKLLEDQLASQLKELEVHRADKQQALDGLQNVEERTQNAQDAHQRSISDLATKLKEFETECDVMLQKSLLKMKKEVELHVAEVSTDLSIRQNSLDEQLAALESKLGKQGGKLDARIAAVEIRSAQQQMQLDALNANEEKHVADEPAGLNAHKASAEKESLAHGEGLGKQLGDMERKLAELQGNFDAYTLTMQNHAIKQQTELQAMEKRLMEQGAKDSSEQAEGFKKQLADLEHGLFKHQSVVGDIGDMEKHSAKQQPEIQVAPTELEVRSLQVCLQELQAAQDEILSDILPNMETHFSKELQGFRGPIEVDVRTLLENYGRQSHDLGGLADKVNQLENALQEAMRGRDEMLADTISRVRADSSALQKKIDDVQVLHDRMQSQVQEVSSSRDQHNERLEQLRHEGRREREDLEVALLGNIKMIETSLRKIHDDQQGLLGDIVPAMHAKVKKNDSSLQKCCDDQKTLLADTVPTMQAKVKQLESSLRRWCDDQVGLLEDTVPTMQAKLSRIESSLQICCDDQEGLLRETLPAMQIEVKEMSRCLQDFGSLQDEMVYSKLPEIESQLKLQVVKRLTSQKAVLEEQANVLWQRFENSMDEREKEAWTKLETTLETHHKEGLVQLEATFQRKHMERFMELETSLENQRKDFAKLESSVTRQKQDLVKFEIALESHAKEVQKGKTEQKPVIPGLAIGSMQQSVADLQPMMTVGERQGLPMRPRGGSSTPSSTPRESRSQHFSHGTQHGSSTPRGTLLREHRGQHRSHSTGAMQRKIMQIDVVTPPGIVTPPSSPASLLKKNGLCRRHPCWHDCHLCSLGTKSSAFDDAPITLSA
eukprot:TRINITY_DN24096_c0_g1_i1.p1 TRINITY_DN24096_c0_g1~~TRINITY_DN24096_c0_g1_i1.p1  ORF type:complete len:1014 (+),score=256.65 TRINITY_DN24096_c0_g1_i1:204-3245(+)